MIARLAVVVALLAAGTSVSAAATAAQRASWYDGVCTDNVGVTVVVDFQDLGGGVNVRCATGAISSGLDALDQAEVLWEGTRRFPGFVCRIAGKPGTDTEACGNTPPATAYWSYWIAARGGSWCYSSVGPSNRTPPPGSIEGWSFALNRSGSDTPKPRLDPPPPIASQPANQLAGTDCGTPGSPSTTVPTTAPPPATTVAPAAPPDTPAPIDTQPVEPGGGDGGDGGSQATPATAGTPTVTPAAGATTSVAPSTTVQSGSSTTSSPSSSTSTSSTSPSTSTAVIASTTSSSSSVPDTSAGGTTVDTRSASSASVPFGSVDLGSDGRDDGGLGAGTIVGVLLIGGLGGAGVWAARRRRSST